MELTNEQLARMYGAYMFTDVNTPQGLCTLWSAMPLGFSTRTIGSFAYGEECKLLLTPLSEITEEDAIEVVKIAYCKEFDKNYKHHIQVRVVQDATVVSINRAIELSVYHEECQFVAHSAFDGSYMPVLYIGEIIDFLRSRGYDCGYGDIPSLIEAGIAIDKTTINQ